MRGAAILPSKTAGLVLLAMVLFACNSILCRLALARSAIDPASFTLVRLASGAVMLGLLTTLGGQRPMTGTWRSAVALFVYAAGFSFAYVSLPAGIGAFLLFATVQATMVIAGLARGNRLSTSQAFGMAIALIGLATLVLPGASLATGRASPMGSMLMVAAGVAWGCYSLLGRGVDRPLPATAGNFIRAVPGGLVLLAAWWAFGAGLSISAQGLLFAVLSGAVASGIGYTVWYGVLPALAPSLAASVQLSVPVMTALFGAALLGEVVTWRLALSSLAIVAGIALVVIGPSFRHRDRAPS